MDCLIIKEKKIMNKTYLLVIVAAVLAICSCTKVEVPVVQGEVLAVKEVPVTAGQFLLPVTVNGENRLVWKARPVSNWLHIDDSNEKENAYTVIVRYDSNESSLNTRNFARVGHIVIETYDGFVADTVVVKQRGLTPSMKLTDTAAKALDTKCTIPFNTNLTDECRPTMTFSADKEWVEGIEYLGNGKELEVKLMVNNGIERSTVVTVSFTDAWGETTTAQCTLTQKELE